MCLGAPAALYFTCQIYSDTLNPLYNVNASYLMVLSKSKCLGNSLNADISVTIDHTFQILNMFL